MTAKEERFERYVNDMQARADELGHLREWRRLKECEEEAILLYHQLDENLEEYSRQMRTADQMEMEYQCQRKKQKSDDLNPQKPLWHLYEMEMRRQGSIKVKEAEERAKDLEEVKIKAVADFKARIQASD